ncbi:hatching enzyme 1.2-like [Anomaloglossus baeobatrachus]
MSCYEEEGPFPSGVGVWPKTEHRTLDSLISREDIATNPGASITDVYAVTKKKTMQGMKLALLLCLAGQALPRPMYQAPIKDDRNSRPEPTVFEVIQAANRDVSVLLKESDVAVNLNRNARKCSTCKWPKNANGMVPVPYVIDPQYSASDVSLINEALSEFEVMTCVQFVNRNSEPDYLSIEPGTGCWSYIGKKSGKQTVSLASPSCIVYGVIQHEAMHNIGFYHEHTRLDRDDYIDILWQNMDEASYSNFDMADGNTFNLPYDYTSVMHYHRFAFSLRDSLSTIVPKPNPNVPIGQRSGMSNLDVMKINANYACNICRVKLVTASGSFSGDSSAANQGGGNCLWLIQVPSNKWLQTTGFKIIRERHQHVTGRIKILLFNPFQSFVFYIVIEIYYRNCNIY